QRRDDQLPNLLVEGELLQCLLDPLFARAVERERIARRAADRCERDKCEPADTNSNHEDTKTRRQDISSSCCRLVVANAAVHRATAPTKPSPDCCRNGSMASVSSFAC